MDFDLLPLLIVVAIVLLTVWAVIRNISFSNDTVVTTICVVSVVFVLFCAVMQLRETYTLNAPSATQAAQQDREKHASYKLPSLPQPAVQSTVHPNPATEIKSCCGVPESSQKAYINSPVTIWSVLGMLVMLAMLLYAGCNESSTGSHEERAVKRLARQAARREARFRSASTGEAIGHAAVHAA